MTRVDPSVTRLATALPGLVAEVRRGRAAAQPIVVSGPPSASAELRRLLTEDGDESLVGAVGILDLDRPELAHAAVIVYLIRRAATPADEAALRRADRQGRPLLCLVMTDEAGRGPVLPYVRATDVIRVPALGRPAIRALATRITARVPEQAWVLAEALPALEPGVARALVERSARRTAVRAAVAGGRRPAMPELTTGQLRLVLRLAAARGVEPEGATAAVGLVGAVATGLLGRALARRLRTALPLPGWAVDAAVAYAGTRAVGRATVARTGGRAVSGTPAARL